MFGRSDAAFVDVAIGIFRMCATQTSRLDAQLAELDFWHGSGLVILPQAPSMAGPPGLAGQG